LAYFIVKVATGIVNTYGPPGRPIFFKGHLVLETLSARGLLKWVLVAFFACAGLLNIFATAPCSRNIGNGDTPGGFITPPVCFPLLIFLALIASRITHQP
jgi:hypothetical protein